ncbi:hypothetical protein I5P78_21680 [Serratia marcescens]|nr:hypothetical protein [Serratia marcescens]
MPNPLYGCPNSFQCALYLGLDGSYYERSNIWFKEIGASRTMGELGANLILGHKISTLETGKRPQCISLGYLAESSSSVFLHFVPLPGGMQCIPPEIVPTACDIRELQLELQYDTLTDGAINGRTASIPLTVVCNFDFKVRISPTIVPGASILTLVDNFAAI